MRTFWFDQLRQQLATLPKGTGAGSDESHQPDQAHTYSTDVYTYFLAPDPLL
jgi:hypothetical protein